ncbi:hypothetical protein D9758_013366 [Tetrapyrgos nigripes]|uniref:RING-type domain-containing protein n=1 Tax=Tetrapyrgos nigripes TaxID=182062 RepID=A0A8H5FNA5_9AGAR|nr:hypothetical protein D9758_013366 [Tetrapyrgos nigripes]
MDLKDPTVKEYLKEASTSTSHVEAYKHLIRPCPSSPSTSFLEMERAFQAIALLRYELCSPPTATREQFRIVGDWDKHWSDISRWCLYLMDNAVLNRAGSTPQWIELQERVMYAIPGIYSSVVASSGDLPNRFTPDIFPSVFKLWLYGLESFHPSVHFSAASVDGFMGGYLTEEHLPRMKEMISQTPDVIKIIVCYLSSRLLESRIPYGHISGCLSMLATMGKYRTVTDGTPFINVMEEYEVTKWIAFAFKRVLKSSRRKKGIDLVSPATCIDHALVFLCDSFRHYGPPAACTAIRQGLTMVFFYVCHFLKQEGPPEPSTFSKTRQAIADNYTTLLHLLIPMTVHREVLKPFLHSLNTYGAGKNGLENTDPLKAVTDLPKLREPLKLGWAWRCLLGTASGYKSSMSHYKRQMAQTRLCSNPDCPFKNQPDTANEPTGAHIANSATKYTIVDVVKYSMFFYIPDLDRVFLHSITIGRLRTEMSIVQEKKEKLLDLDRRFPKGRIPVFVVILDQTQHDINVTTFPPTNSSSLHVKFLETYLNPNVRCNKASSSSSHSSCDLPAHFLSQDILESISSMSSSSLADSAGSGEETLTIVHAVFPGPVDAVVNTYYGGLLKPLVSALDTPIHDMDQNTSTIAELRAEQVDQISDNVSRLSYRLASLDTSADADSSSPSPLPRRLQWVVDRSKELFNELEPNQLVIVLPTIRQLMERVNKKNGLDFRVFEKFAQLLSRLVAVKERRNKLPVVRYLPCISDLPPSELNGPAPPEWLAMFVHSDVPSVCIEDHNACCNICLEDFEEPALAAEFQVDGSEDGTQATRPKPLRQLICGHEDCLPMFQNNDYDDYDFDETFECPVCRAEIWTVSQFSLLSAEIPRDTALNSTSSDQLQTYDDYYNTLPPWEKIHGTLLNWAISLPISRLDSALNSTIRGHPVNEDAVCVWGNQTYKRYVYSRMTDSPEGLVDCGIIGSLMARFLSTLISRGDHAEASRLLRESHDSLQAAPRLLAVLAKHGHADDCHWVVHRFSLPDGALTTYHFHAELHACHDCRPASWWPIIRLAWPDAAICPNPACQR